MLLQISVTNVHEISERFALVIKYLGNVADGDKDHAVAGAHCRPLAAVVHDPARRCLFLPGRLPLAVKRHDVRVRLGLPDGRRRRIGGGDTGGPQQAPRLPPPLREGLLPEARVGAPGEKRHNPHAHVPHPTRVLRRSRERPGVHVPLAGVEHHGGIIGAAVYILFFLEAERAEIRLHARGRVDLGQLGERGGR